MKATYILIAFAVGLNILVISCKKDKPTENEPLLIASYPLSSDGLDSTGNNSAMNLQNTPFQNGGIYCNGIYVSSAGVTSCVAQSPSINSFKFESFSITVDFFVSEKRNQPVWVIGTGCRWLGFYLRQDGTIALLYNNSNYLTLQTTYTLSEWHNAKISYDGVTVTIFLDNSLAGSLKFGNGYVPLDNSSCGTADSEIAVTNYSNGEVLKGYIKNLRVYNLQ